MTRCGDPHFEKIVALLAPKLKAVHAGRANSWNVGNEFRASCICLDANEQDCRNGKEQAITLIERLLSTPGPVGASSEAGSNITLADLRLRWEWDSLRHNPRFEQILAGPEPKTVY